MNRLADLTAIVTGGSRGIGRGIVARFVAEGARVLNFDRDAPGAPVDGTRVELGSVASEADVARAVDAAVAWTGRLDIVVNNAGIMAFKPFEQLALADWQRVIDTNLTGSFLVARAAAPHLRKTKGTIINLTSIRAYQSEANTEAYSATKGGLFALTHALANTLAPIRVNAIAPGWIHTDDSELRPIDHAQHLVGRVGTPDDVAALAVYLASSEAGFVTGQTFTIDGGITAKLVYAQ